MVMGTYSGSSSGYEFSAEENKKIERVASRVNLYGGICTVTGVLMLLFGVAGSLMSLSGP